MKAYGIYKNIRESAWKCLIDHKITTLPVDIIRIARASDLHVIKDSHVSVLAPLENGRSYYDGKNWYIVYNDKSPLPLARFTVAHELGHIFLGHELKYLKYSRARAIQQRPNFEIEADRFAIRLLSPACVLWGLGLHSPEEIASYCHIDLELAAKRAERMKLLYRRGKFLSSPLERQLFNEFMPFIQAQATKSNRR